MDLPKTCFIISTIGEENSPERELADEKYDLVFEPVLQELNYKVTRADKIGTPGSISYDIVTHLINSDVVLADVSDLNPNVFYELSIRNAIKKPVIVVKSVGQKMPFDIYDKRAISIDMTKPRIWTNAKEQLRKQINESQKDKEIASKSILSEFTFQIDVERKITPDKEMLLELKDLKNEVRRLSDSNFTSTSKQQSSFNLEDLQSPFASKLSSSVRYFLNLLRTLNNEGRLPIAKRDLLNELLKNGFFDEKTAEQYIEKMVNRGYIFHVLPNNYTTSIV